MIVATAEAVVTEAAVIISAQELTTIRTDRLSTAAVIAEVDEGDARSGLTTTLLVATPSS